jgi:hypothetical protein
MNILQAMQEPVVFGGSFRNPDSWTAWRAFLAALFGLEMDPAARLTFKKCTGRTERDVRGYDEAWLICGRGSGKSFVLALCAVYLAAFRDWRAGLGPGERATVMVIATDRRQARVIMRFIRGLLTAVPMLRRQIENETREGIDLKTRISIEVHAASFRSTRGYGIAAGLLDEMAFWPTEDAAEPDYEILGAIRPGLARVPGSMLLCASSPHAKRGALYDAYRKHFGKDGDRVLVWRAPTRTMNPTIPQRVIDAALLEDPAKNRSEYLAEFRQDLESFIAREQVLACVDTGVRERPPVAGTKYVSFVDPSGGSGDSMTCAVGHMEGQAVVVDALRHRGVRGAAPPLWRQADLRRQICRRICSTGVREGGRQVQALRAAAIRALPQPAAALEQQDHPAARPPARHQPDRQPRALDGARCPRQRRSSAWPARRPE